MILELRHGIRSCFLFLLRKACETGSENYGQTVAAAYYWANTLSFSSTDLDQPYKKSKDHRWRYFTLNFCIKIMSHHQFSRRTCFKEWASGWSASVNVKVFFLKKTSPTIIICECKNREREHKAKVDSESKYRFERFCD